jgi:hypothetical protein
VTFECLFAFLVMSHGRRQLLWFAVTRYPTAAWLAQQIVEAFPWDTAPTWLVRDNDGAYGLAFTRRVRANGDSRSPDLAEVALAESVCRAADRDARRDCLDHVMIFGEQHLRRVLTLYSAYYNDTRTHLGLGKDAPLRRAIERSGTMCPYQFSLRKVSCSTRAIGAGDGVSRDGAAFLGLRARSHRRRKGNS